MSHLESSKLFSVEGLVAVITGGGSGLGRTMALTLSTNNASKVFVLGRRKQNLEETALLAGSNSGKIIPVVCDVTSQDSLQQAYDSITSQTEYIDLLVANSGIVGPRATPATTTPGEKPTLTQLRDHLWQAPMEEFTQVQHVNITGSFYTAIAFLPLLDKANQRRQQLSEKSPAPPPRPQIIITSSISGFLRAVPTSWAYTTSKAGVNSLIKALSTTLAEYQIRVNGIAPGIYHSDMSEPFFTGRGIPDHGVVDGSVPKELIPLTRAGTQEDIAGLILWMAGNAGGYLNGNIVVTDGGRLGSLPATY